MAILNKNKNYFQGWYYKNQDKDKIISLIPAFHIDGAGRRSASLQIITPGEAYQIFYPQEEFKAAKGKPAIRIGGSRFTDRGLVLRIRTEKLTASGALRFTPFIPLRYDIMGPFRYVPLMQCRHSVYSLAHGVEGRLVINGTSYAFRQGVGYTEGDRGSGFPGDYLWTQCSFPEREHNCVMVSVAKVLIGGRISFRGCIGVVYYKGREYRFATYLGVRIVKYTANELWLRQGKYELKLLILEKYENCLLAPVKGKMIRTVYESVNARIRYRFTRGNREIFDITETGCFERGL